MGFFEASQLGVLERERRLYDNYVARLREYEYPMLKGVTYLDHGGTTLASKTLLDRFAREMQSTLLSNPHSDTSNPSASAMIIAETRQKVLRFFNADPQHFDVIFTANATAAVKMVAECLSGLESGFDYCFHRNCHTSLVGVREIARSSHCLASDEETEVWLDGEHHVDGSSSSRVPTLFAYPAQSNMNGQRLPLDWAQRLRNSKAHTNTYTLLDVAALVSTTKLDLSNAAAAPDFIAMSFYKIFGFPDLGALLVRKASAHVLQHRKYFGGGTTEMINCFGSRPWVERKQSNLHARLEDGTIAIRNILALNCAIDTHYQLFGAMDEISEHTSWLASILYDRLSSISFEDGTPVCHIYKDLASTYGDPKTQGATVVFNLRKIDGSWMGAYSVGKILRSHNIHVRTGSLCNPGGMACALDVSPETLRAAFDAGFRCNQQDDVREDGHVFGMVRVTLGAMSTLSDVDALANCIESCFVNLVDAREDSAYESTYRCKESNKEKTVALKSKLRQEDSPSSPSSSRSVWSKWQTLFMGCVTRRAGY